MNTWVAKICQYSSFSLLSKTEPQIQTASTARDTMLTSRILSRTAPPFVIGLHSSSLPYSGRPPVALFRPTFRCFLFSPTSLTILFLPFHSLKPLHLHNLQLQSASSALAPHHATPPVAFFVSFSSSSLSYLSFYIFSCKTIHAL